MTQPLCTCGRPSPDATLCARCGHLLDAALAEIVEYHGLGWDLDIARTRQARIGDRTGSRANVVPIPYDERASQAADDLHNVLGTWCRFIDEHLAPRPYGPHHRHCAHGSCQLIRYRDMPEDTITAIATWLRPRAGWLRHHPAGSEALDDIRDAVRQARRAVDRPADRLYAGPCRGCQTDMYARIDAAYIVCTGCETPWDVAELRAWLLDCAQDVLATATEISRALTRYASPVTPSAIRGYVHRGQLAPHGQRTEGHRDVPLYRLGDVVDCVTRAAAVRSERIGA